jgi:pyruvate dehydrogenase E2 component (dihydrolipoamide acetyltransferase)
MIEITMPRLSDTMEEGAIASWQVGVGDKVSPGDVLAEIETDKAVMDFEAYEPGTVTELLVEPGSVVSIGEPIALLDDGSGPGGRVIRIDVERALAERHARPAQAPATAVLPEAEGDRRIPSRAGSGASSPPPGAGVRGGGATASGTGGGGDDRESVRAPLSQVRRVIARRLTQSAQEIPVFTATVAVRVDELAALRRQLNQHLEGAGRGRVSVNDLVVKAAALALREYPQVNASWGEDHIAVHGRVNIGIAVAAERGLVVPVIKDADAKTPAQLGAEARSLAALAVDGKLAPDQMSGGTFTVSNLGMYGVEEFTAIINPPEAAILAVGAARGELALVDGAPAERQVMRITLSADHRMIDGALGAQFLGAVRTLLENPWALLA